MQKSPFYNISYMARGGNVIGIKIAHSPLRELPAQIQDCPSSRSCSLQENQLQALPAGLAGLPRLARVNVHSNPMKQVPDKKHQVTASLFGHVGHGQLLIRPFLDLSDPEHIRRMQHLARDLYQEVLQVGVTVSGEHADGLSRTWFLREQYGPLYPVFVQVKRIFDPQSAEEFIELIRTLEEKIR